MTATGEKGDAEEVVEYKAPAPPEGTGLHRYVFVVLVPRNGTSERLHLSKPEERRHWGFEGERSGVREWADENGLVVIGKFDISHLGLDLVALFFAVVCGSGLPLSLMFSTL